LNDEKRGTFVLRLLDPSGKEVGGPWVDAFLDGEDLDMLRCRRDARRDSAAHQEET
jgi:hypothetical protein